MKQKRKSMAQQKALTKKIQAFLALCFVFVLIGLLSNPQFDNDIGTLIFVTIVGSAVVCTYSLHLKRNQRNRVRQALIAAGTEDPSQLTQHQYERFCGIILENNGWKVRYTSSSRDYGADIVAIRNGATLIIQCKQNTTPIGLNSVREVHAALNHYNGITAALVTIGDYTKPARNLARSTGVLLLNHTDLIDI